MTGAADLVAGARPLAKRFEGWRPRRYFCPAGVATQGYGHTGKGVDGTAWSVAKGEAVLDADLAVYARAVLALSPNLARLPAAVGASLADFCFNLGVTRYKASTLRRRVAAERWADVGRELGKWVHGAGRRLPGLVTRRAAEAQAILQAMSGDDPSHPPLILVDEARRILETSKDPIGDLRRLLAA